MVQFLLDKRAESADLIVHLHYWVTHLLADLDWVDFDLGCSTVLLGLHHSCSTAQRPVEHPKPSQPNPSPRGDGSPCTYHWKCHSDGQQGPVLGLPEAEPAYAPVRRLVTIV